MNFGNRLMTVSPHLLDWASNTSAGPRANQASSILMFPVPKRELRNALQGFSEAALNAHDICWLCHHWLHSVSCGPCVGGGAAPAQWVRSSNDSSAGKRLDIHRPRRWLDVSHMFPVFYEAVVH